jgi:hypothetical protein
VNAKARTSNAMLNLGIGAAFVAWFAVVVNKRAFDPPIYTALLAALMLTAIVLTWLHEARRERQLDELELAGLSFGARWSTAVLGFTVLLLLFVAPLQDTIVGFAEAYEDHDSRPLPAPVGVFTFGFVVAIFIQMASKSALGAIWMWTKR